MENLHSLISKIKDLFLLLIGYAKGYWDRGQAEKARKLEAEVKALQRLRNVQINTDRDAALDRLRRSGHVRDD
jgi:hypothetical protein